MLIKTKTVAAGEAQAATDYALAPGENERVTVLEGSPEIAHMHDEFAQLCGQKTGLLHITINPGLYDLSESEREHIIMAIKAEYGIPLDSLHFLVEHEKIRKDGTYQKHEHLYAQAQNAHGNLVNTWRSKKRDELLSRFMEIELNHRITPGRHNAWVHEKMIERGLDRHAAVMDQFKDVVKVARYTEAQNARSKRLGFNIDLFTSGLSKIAEMPHNEQARNLAALIDQFEGCDIDRGNKRSRILLRHPSGEKPFNINKILKIKARETGKFIHETQEILNGLREPNVDPENGQTTKQPRFDDSNSEKSDDDHRTADNDHREPQRGGGNEHDNKQTAGGAATSAERDHKVEELNPALADQLAALRKQAVQMTDSVPMKIETVDLPPAPNPRDRRALKRLSEFLKRASGARQQAPGLKPAPRPGPGL